MIHTPHNALCDVKIQVKAWVIFYLFIVTDKNVQFVSTYSTS